MAKKPVKKKAEEGDTIPEENMVFIGRKPTK